MGSHYEEPFVIDSSFDAFLFDDDVEEDNMNAFMPPYSCAAGPLTSSTLSDSRNASR